jgi:hypothetical protein
MYKNLLISLVGFELSRSIADVPKLELFEAINFVKQKGYNFQSYYTNLSSTIIFSKDTVVTIYLIHKNINRLKRKI